VTRAQWLADVAARGGRVYLRDGVLCVRGSMSPADRRRLDEDRRGIGRLLARRRRDAAASRETPAPEPAPVETRAVVGQQARYGADGRLVEWAPVYARGTDGHAVSARLDLLQRISDARSGQVVYGAYDVALCGLAAQAARIADRIGAEMAGGPSSPTRWPAPARWPKSKFRA
jgi:hypothetical protein